jgi:type II secretory pathway component HofQ
MDLPLIGWLFRLKEAESQKNELVIFLTPRIIPNGEAP